MPTMPTLPGLSYI